MIKKEDKTGTHQSPEFVGENIRKTTDSNESGTKEYSPGNHPNSLSNLKPFPKGVSGNPLGRPHRFEKLAATLNKMADEEVVNHYGESRGYTRREGVLDTIWKKAMAGEIKYVQMLAWLGCLDGEI